jgi:isocitrate lyase
VWGRYVGLQDVAGLSPEEMADFNVMLGRLGFVWQFITLAGFHSNGLIATMFARCVGVTGDDDGRCGG